MIVRQYLSDGGSTVVVLHHRSPFAETLELVDSFYFFRWATGICPDIMSGFREEEDQTNGRSSSKHPTCFPVSVTHTEFPATYELFVLTQGGI